MAFAWICNQCDHPASDHRLVHGATVSGPYDCLFGTCRCTISQDSPMRGVNEATFLSKFPDAPHQLRKPLR